MLIRFFVSLRVAYSQGFLIFSGNFVTSAKFLGSGMKWETSEVKKLSENTRKPWLNATLKEIKNLINNQTLLIEDQKEGEPVTPCMDVYKSNIQSDGSLDKLKLRIVVRGDLQNKEMVGDTWSPTASMRTLNYFLSDAARHKARVHR